MSIRAGSAANQGTWDSRTRLDSWKEIAAYLGRTVRTVQRWEACGLPVRRHLHASSSSVYAYASEIDRWWRTRGPEVDIALSGVAEIDVQPVPQPVAADASRAASLLILPFADLSADGSCQYLCEGIAEELITALAKVGISRVHSWSAIAGQIRAGAAVEDLVRVFQPSLLIEGSVRRFDDRVRVLARAIAQPGREVVWADSFEEPLSHFLNLEEQIARGVFRACGVNGERRQLLRSHSLMAEAHDLYLVSRHYWNERSVSALKKSVSYAEEALERDPGYALASAGLALASATLATYTSAAPAEPMERARTAALEALERDNSLSEAHAALGLVHLGYDWDWGKAEASFRRAIECDATNAIAYQWYAFQKLVTGHYTEALQLASEAGDLEPGSPILKCQTVWLLYFLHRFDEAIARGEAAVRRYPKFWRAHFNLGCCYLATGRTAEAVETMKACHSGGQYHGTAAALAVAYARNGDIDHARTVQQEIVSSGEYVTGYWMAMAAAALGDSDAAIGWLQRAHDHREWYWIFASREPLLDPIRDSAHFARLVSAVGA